MSTPTPELQRLTILLGGSFNPTILQPAWFAAEKLLRKGEAEAAQNLMVSAEYTAFSLDWMTLEARTDQISIFGEDPSSYDLMRDLVVGTFSLLKHTPVSTLQIIQHTHFKSESVEAWHKAGDLLAPKDVYKDVLKKPGLLHIQIQGQRVDDRAGETVFVAQPSNRIKPGIYLAVGDAYRLDSADDTEARSGVDLMTDILTSDWTSAMEHRRQTVETILSRV